MSIILASQSPRRKQLLEWAEIDFEVMVVPTDESYPDYLAIEEIPIHIARQKAFAVEQVIGKEKMILAADTLVVLHENIIGKPKDREDAIKILSNLSGNVHSVITGVVLLNGFKEIAFADVTEVTFHTLTQEQIIFYVDKYKPYDKAGAYAIQEWIGVVGIQSIKGDFYNVMGLPVSRVVQVIKDMM
ncbi:MAG TPA: Maf family nucleotide pyrophosphatase [Chitinophagaceae bacterium]|nr:septum formation protein Maf [Chitinophagaceae bacterium]HNE93014.1 Maf family nucleotide pyrophosphatase [Chitinophagaceae bacterium]HNN32058.1 Maf family nucleotide pyrophosphatase [Chitinophagaceae bacterium]